MQRKLINLIGTQFGKLIVIDRVFDKPKQTRWLCKCDCGNETIVYSRNLRGGFTKSCGCYNHSEEWKVEHKKGLEKFGVRLGKNHPKWNGGKDKIICVECGKEFLDYKTNNRILCSKKCAGKYQGRQRLGENSHFWKNGKPKCVDCAKTLTGYGSVRCMKCAGIFKRINQFLEDKRECNRYKIWRKDVYQRDNWKCRIGDKNCSGRIIAHHILGWASYPELRYEVNNGITLCLAHHPLKRAEEKRLSPFFMDLVSVSKV